MSFVDKYLLDMDLSFRDFVELALYHPVHGYYSRPENHIQKSGDYVTAPSISPVFGFALARLASEFVQRMGDGLCAIVDIGCGNGGLLRSIVEQMSSDARKRTAFYGIDRSLSRIDDLARPLAHFDSSIDAIPRGVPVLALSNELFDAFPFARLVARGDDLHELWVTRTDEGLDWAEREAPSEYADYFTARSVELQDGQFADVALEWGREYAAIAERIERGMIVTIDYGFDDQRLFDPRVRRFGTAAAFSRHRVSRDLLSSPGEQDLTAHINFSDLQRAGDECGFSTLSFARQASFLLSLGVTDHPLLAPAGELATNSLQETVDLADEREAARRLVLPDGIGEEMRVLVQAKGIATDAWSFQKRLF